jgi:hypothetical protein
MTQRGEVLPDESTTQPGLIFMDEAERALFVEASLGEEAHRFVHSDLGRLVLARAKEEIEQAKDALLAISPWSPLARRKLRAAQFKVSVAQQFPQWLAEAIQNADEAYQQLKARQ